MKLSSKVLLLWGVRIFLLPLPFTPILEKGFGSKLLLWVSYLLISSVVFLVSYIKYRTCVITLSPAGISVTCGYFIRKHLYIKHRHILALTKVCTPLSQKLHLYNLVFCCEGSTFILPPLDRAFTEQIESEFQSRSDDNET